MRSALLAGIAAALTFVPAATAATKSQANAKARKAADAYTDKNYGISGGASFWTATCRTSGSAWTCSLGTTSGQCSGSLKLSSNLSKTYAVKIGCGE